MPSRGNRTPKKKACNFVRGVVSPLLANLLLDGFDKELERRGHRFVRYADDSNIYVNSAEPGNACWPV